MPILKENHFCLQTLQNLKFIKDQLMLITQLTTSFQILEWLMKLFILKITSRIRKQLSIMKLNQAGNKMLTLITQETILSQILDLMKRSNMLKMVLHGLKTILVMSGHQPKTLMAIGMFQKLLPTIHIATMIESQSIT